MSAFEMAQLEVQQSRSKLNSKSISLGKKKMVTDICDVPKKKKKDTFRLYDD